MEGILQECPDWRAWLASRYRTVGNTMEDSGFLRCTLLRVKPDERTQSFPEVDSRG